VLIWEHAAKRAVPPVLGSLGLMRTRRHGATAISLFIGLAEAERSAEASGSEPDGLEPNGLDGRSRD
jgi:hypothetical protein